MKIKPNVHNLLFLSVDGQWGSWSGRGTCSETCGKSGTKTKSRICNNPSPQYGGNQCNTIDSTQTAGCTISATNPCPKGIVSVST